MADRAFPTSITGATAVETTAQNALWISAGTGAGVPDFALDKIGAFSDLVFNRDPVFEYFIRYGTGGARSPVRVGYDQSLSFRLYGDPQEAKIQEILRAADAVNNAGALCYFVRRDRDSNYIQDSGVGRLAISGEGTDARGIIFWELQLEIDGRINREYP